jgi:outer membrane receptor protein involved in Fe transport
MTIAVLEVPWLKLAKMLVLASWGVLILWTRQGAAQGQPHVLEEIVVQDQATEPEVPQATVPRQEIDRETVRSISTTRIESSLEWVPDLYVRRNEPFRLGASTVRLQGADPNKVAVLLNGQRMLGGVDGVVDLRDLPTELLERIEIERGVAGGFTDSEAMAGSINVITRRPSATPQWSASAAAGSFDRIFFAASHSYQWRRLGYSLAYEHDEYALAKQFGAISRQFEGANANAKQVRDNVFVQGTWNASDQHELSGIVHVLPVREGPQSRRLNVTTSLQGKVRFPAGTDLTWSGGRYGFDRSNDLPGFQEDVGFQQWYGELRVAPPPLLLWQTQNAFEFGYRVRRPELHLLPLGAGGTQLPPGTAEPSVREATALQTPFLQYEWSDLAHWSVAAGSNFDLHSLFGLEVNPRVVVTWRPSGQFRLSAGVGRGFRAPDLLQLYDIDLNNVIAVGGRPTGYAILGDPKLRPEIDYVTNLEFTWLPAAGIRLNGNAFRHDFRNLIDVVLRCVGPQQCSPGFAHPFPALVGQVFQYANVAEAETAGADVSVELSWHQLWPGRISFLEGALGLHYGFLYSRNQSSRPGESGKELPFRPPHRFIPTWFARHRSSGLSGRIWAEYEDRVFSDLQNTAANIARAHWTVNARLEWAVTKEVASATALSRWRWLDGVALFVEGNNLSDVEYGVPGPLTRLAGRRSILVGVRAR